MSYATVTGPYYDGPWGYGYGRQRHRWGWAGLGETSNWAQFIVSPNEVYLWRARLHGAKIVAPDQALVFVRAVGKGQSQHLDVRGVALSKQGDTDWDIDVVLTSSVYQIEALPRNADGVAQKVLTDPQVRQVFPSLLISEPQFRQLTGSVDDVDHWRSQPLLWDHLLGGDGGPTDTFAQPAEYSIVLGTADDGKRAQPWKVKPPGLGPNGEKKPPGPATNAVLLLGAVAIGGYVIAQTLKDKKKGRKP